jgi:hypothetical protein
MIVGSVLPRTLRRQAEVKGAHRTAGPDHVSGSSDPMFPKPLDARPFRIASPGKGEVYHSTISAKHRLQVGDIWPPMETDLDSIKT